jgi:hypothetical protein
LLRLILILTFLFPTLLGCNTTESNFELDGSTNSQGEVNLSKPPSQVVEDGSCMANTLSFLVGQPETALEAMKYPENTRILVHGQVVNFTVEPSRLNLVLGRDRNIRFVYCG